MNTSGAFLDVPEGWITVVNTFLEAVIWQEQVNDSMPVEIIRICERNNDLVIHYSGGDADTDVLYMFARRMAKKMCVDCGSPVTSSKFGPKCDQHI